MGKAAKKNKLESSDVEDTDRASYTPGWNKRISQEEGLPIKKGDKVIRVVKDVVEKEVDEESDYTEDEEEAPEVSNSVATPVEPSEFEYVADAGVEEHEDQVFERERQKKDKTSDSVMKFKTKSQGSIRKIQQKLADICTSITSNPERSLKRKLEVDDSGDRVYRMVDLFEMLNSSDIQIFEMAMLSALLVFKDICPGYRLRTQEESDAGAQKKETKALREFELALLGSYKKYLMVLDEKVQLGLGNAKKELTVWGPEQQLGLSALRCMCELIRALSHFNFKSQLLSAVVTRAGQPVDEVSTMCCETLTTVVESDFKGETSYEIVRLIAKILVTNKYEVPHRLIKCLEKVKMQVHADESKRVHQKAKRERRKRKKSDDDVEAGLLESKATNDELTKKRFQADALTEVSLIYFRIIKMKVGFGLLPVALEGLGGITHLINMETVEDLITLMRGILESNPPAPEIIQLLCVHCALRTLSGPGQILNIDEEIFIVKLRGLIKELPSDFERWDIVLECLDLCFLQKREERPQVVTSFVKSLMVVAVHLTVSSASTVLAMVHAILLRYPRTRQALSAIAESLQSGNVTASVDEEEKVVDFAMQALREGSDQKSSADATDDIDGDGSWVLTLLRHHMDGRYKHITNALTSKDLLPLTLRTADARYNPLQRVSDRLESYFKTLPSTLISLKRSRETHAKQETEGNEEAPAKKKGFFKKSKEESNSFKNKAKGGKVPVSSASKGGFNKNFKKNGNTNNNKYRK